MEGPTGLGNCPACSASGTLAIGLNVSSGSNLDNVNVNHQVEHVQLFVEQHMHKTELVASSLQAVGKDRKETTTPFGVNLMRSQVLYQAAKYYTGLPRDLKVLKFQPAPVFLVLPADCT